MSTTPETLAIAMPIPPGLEMERLVQFHRDVRWTGTIEAGGVGPGSPAMTARGRSSHQMIKDGRWIVGTYEQDQFLEDGTFVLTWQLHWVAGWDPTSGAYRATVANNYGHAEVTGAPSTATYFALRRSATRRPAFD